MIRASVWGGAQARRQDLAAGGQIQKEGPKTSRGGAHFKNTVLDVCSNQGAKREMGGTYFKWGPATTAHPLAAALVTQCSPDSTSFVLSVYLNFNSM